MARTFMRLPRFTTLQLLLGATLVGLVMGLLTAAWSAGKPERIHHVCFSPSGKYLAAGYQDGIARVWRVDGNRPQLLAELYDDTRHVGADAGFIRLHFINEERIVKIESDPTRSIILRQFDLSSGRTSNLVSVGRHFVLRTWVTTGANHIYLPDRPGLGTSLQCFNLESGKVEGRYAMPESKVSSVGVSADDNRLAARGENGVLYLIDKANGQPILQFPGEEKDVFAMNRDGSRIVTVGLGPSQMPSVVLLDASNKEELENLPFTDAASAYWIAFSRNGSLIAMASQRCVECYDTDLKVIVQRIPAAKLPPTLPFYSPANQSIQLTLTPSGKTLVSWEGDAITFWDIQSGRVSQRIGGGSRLVPAAIFILCFAAWAAIWGIVAKHTRLRDHRSVVTSPENSAPLSPPFPLVLCWGLMIVGGVVALGIPIVLLFRLGSWPFFTIPFSLFVGLAA